MFAVGRLSVRIVCPVVKVAVPLPPLARWIFQVHGVPRKVAPPTLSVLTAVRSGALTVTVSLQPLLVKSLSTGTCPGFTAHTPPVGFAYVPIAVGVARKLTSIDPGAAIETAPFAVHVSVLLAIAQLILPPPMPTGLDVLAAP